MEERYSAYKHQYPTYTTEGEGRDGDIGRFHTRYELVPANFLFHFVGPRQSLRDYLTDLRKGTYIGLPRLTREEYLAYIPRNSFYPTTMKPRGEELWGAPERSNDHIKHRLVRCPVEILLDHPPRPLVTKRHEDILAYKDCPPETRRAKKPWTIKLSSKKRLVPDFTRGITCGDNALFFHGEVDTGTERLTAAYDTTSIEDKVDDYCEYFNLGLYRTLYGFKYAPSVVFFTTRSDITQMVKVISERCDKKWRDRFYVVQIPKKPLPTTNLFVPWQGVDGTLDLMELLNGLARKDAKSGSALQGDTGEGSGAGGPVRRHDAETYLE